MWNAQKALVLTILTGITLGGCAKKDEPVERAPAAARPDSPSATGALTQTASADSPPVPGFDINTVPVVNPQLGAFPYVGVIDNYTRSKSNRNKDVAFDRYEFFDGFKIIPVEGRLTTIGAEGQSASAFEIFKTYEALVTKLGGVKVYEGADPRHLKPRGPEYTDRRHRHGFTADRAGVYMVRTPESEIWVEAYVSPEGVDKEGYFLTVVEKKGLEVRASMLPAEEMKRELDAKGHVALYINFDFDKANIKPESQPIIDEILTLLKDNPGLSLTVEGHTDNVGAPDYNKRLSASRANSVVASLTSKGVQPGRLKAAGYGQEKPIADNATDAGRAQNRRVELVKAG